MQRPQNFKRNVRLQYRRIYMQPGMCVHMSGSRGAVEPLVVQRSVAAGVSLLQSLPTLLPVVALLLLDILLLFRILWRRQRRLIATIKAFEQIIYILTHTCL